MNEYKKTILPIKFPILDSNYNNFVDIFNQFDNENNDYKFNDYLNNEQFHKEKNFKLNEKVNEENLKVSDNENFPNIEVHDNGSIEIKNNNKYSNEKNNDKIFSEFNENEENIEINNINNKNIQINNINNINNYNINNINYIDDMNIINKDNGINFIRKNYKQTDISQINQSDDILNNDKFNHMINSIDNNDVNINNMDDLNSANVRLNLDSDYKGNKKEIFGPIYEEDNESYDSMSLHKSIKSGTKATPSRQEFKKKSLNFMHESNINNNLFNSFNKEKNNNNIMIEEINLEKEDKKNINKENKINLIDLGYNSGDYNDINYTTPESKRKTMETMCQNDKFINEEKDNICELKEFSPLENDDIKFSDFNLISNENDIKEKSDINKNETINIINNSEKNKEIIINKVIKKDKFKNEYLNYIIIDKNNNKILFLGNKDNNGNIINNKRFNISFSSYFRILQLCLKIKLTQKKLYENFIIKLINRLQKYNGNNHHLNQNAEINNDLEIEKDIVNLENKIKYLKDCYLYLIVKKKKLKSKNEINKLIKDLDISKNKIEIEKLLDNLLFYLKEKEKPFYDFYIMKIRKILEKNQIIHNFEINDAKIKDDQNSLKLPIFEEFIFKDKEHNIQNNDKLFSIFSFILPFFFICIFLIINLKETKL